MDARSLRGAGLPATRGMARTWTTELCGTTAHRPSGPTHLDRIHGPQRADARCILLCRNGAPPCLEPTTHLRPSNVGGYIETLFKAAGPALTRRFRGQIGAPLSRGYHSATARRDDGYARVPAVAVASTIAAGVGHETHIRWWMLVGGQCGFTRRLGRHHQCNGRDGVPGRRRRADL